MPWQRFADLPVRLWEGSNSSRTDMYTATEDHRMLVEPSCAAGLTPAYLDDMLENMDPVILERARSPGKRRFFYMIIIIF